MIPIWEPSTLPHSIIGWNHSSKFSRPPWNSFLAKSLLRAVLTNDFPFRGGAPFTPECLYIGGGYRCLDIHLMLSPRPQESVRNFQVTPVLINGESSFLLWKKKTHFDWLANNTSNCFYLLNIFMLHTTLVLYKQIHFTGHVAQFSKGSYWNFAFQPIEFFGCGSSLYFCDLEHLRKMKQAWWQNKCIKDVWRWC